MSSRGDRPALVLDLALYAGSAAFAGITAATSTLTPHRAWGSIAWAGYTLAALVTVLFLTLSQRRRAGATHGTGGARWASAGAVVRGGGAVVRGGLVGLTWVAVGVVPLLVQAWQRASGRSDRVQDEVIVVENAAIRLLHSGTPYLDRADIAAWPADQWLFGYAPYQPLMMVSGIPRAVFGAAWWTDARVWFAVATVALLAVGLRQLYLAGAPGAALVRVAQSLTVLPLAALTLATGGHDLPVVALCLLAFGFAARHSPIGAGLAIGFAGAMKLNAWPIAVVLLAHVVGAARMKHVAAHGGYRAADSRATVLAALRFAAPAFGLPLLALAPALAINAGAVYENVVRYSLLDRGLVKTTAQSPLPGRVLVLAFGTPGRLLAGGLLAAVAIAIGVRLVRQPLWQVSSAAALSAIGTAASILLAPSTRFGYLIYPIAIAMWLPALRSIDAFARSDPLAPSRDAVAGRTQKL